MNYKRGADRTNRSNYTSAIFSAIPKASQAERKERLRKCVEELKDEPRFTEAVLTGKRWPWSMSFDRAKLINDWRKKQNLRKKIYASAHRTGGVIVAG